MKNKTVILITGPTASGKTSLAIRAAQHFQTEIISADSRQCYKEMNIGVAKPSPEELRAVKHYFINSHSIHNDVNAATFADYAHDAAAKIFMKNEVAVMVGGTGLYIKAFIEGLDEIPPISGGIRENIVKEYESKGFQWLQEEVKSNDPKFFEEGEILNPQRLMRALEVKMGTGRSIREFHRKQSTIAGEDKYEIRRFAIDIPREVLYENINQRVERMMEDGLMEEVMELEPYRQLNALQTVGYTELFEHLDGKISLIGAVEKIKQNTRHYAKRQMTWFRKDKKIKWIREIGELLQV